MAIRGRPGPAGTLTLFDDVTGVDLLTIAPDGTVNVLVAGKFQVAGVTGVGITVAGVTASAAEINVLTGVTPGTAKASATAVLGTNKNLDVLVLPVGGLFIGAGAGTAIAPTAAAINLLTQGVAAGYKVARGVHTQVAAVDTIVTGLATVVAVVVSWALAPTAKQTFVIGGIGNQAGAPAAGSILVSTFKSDYSAATDFTDALASSWIAVGV